MSFVAILTNLGIAKIATATSTGIPVNITTGKVGDGGGSVVTPDATWTDLTRVVYTGAIDNTNLNPANHSQVFCELKIPAASGGFTIREVGLYDSSGALIAVASHPSIYKPGASEGATTDVIVRLILAVANTAAVTLISDTTVIIASRSWVSANYSLAALIPGGTTGQMLVKNSNTSGDTKWISPSSVTVVVPVIEETQTLATSQTVVTLTVCTTASAAVYVAGLRLLPTQWTATSSTVITLATSYTSGTKIDIVQNNPAGAAAYLACANNLSDLENAGMARSNLGLLSDTGFLNSFWQLMMQRSYPVGEIYVTRQTGNPSLILGFGTWVAYSAGRVLVGVDTGDASFNSLDFAGGEKAHTLTTLEMPEHNHNLTIGTGAVIPAVTKNSAGSTTINDTTSIQSAGGGNPHNNLQPYICVFMWKRTA